MLTCSLVPEVVFVWEERRRRRKERWMRAARLKGKVSECSRKSGSLGRKEKIKRVCERKRRVECVRRPWEKLSACVRALVRKRAKGRKECVETQKLRSSLVCMCECVSVWVWEPCQLLRRLGPLQEFGGGRGGSANNFLIQPLNFGLSRD